MKKWISAFRPKTLTAAIVPILVASAYSYYLNSFSLWISVFAFLAACSIQIATNLFNDAIDFKKGADEKRQGPVRITQSGSASYSKVMKLAGVFLFLACVFGAPLVYIGGTDIFVIGLLSLFFAYSYTGGPFPLAYLGIADLFVILFFGIIAVGGLCFLQTGNWEKEYLYLGIQVGLVCNLMLAINNLRDYKNDREVNKKTLVARFGEKFGRTEVIALYMLPFFFSLFWYFRAMHFTAFLVYLLFPVAVGICIGFLRTEHGPKLNKFLGISSLYYMLFGIVLSIGMVLDHG